MRPDPEGARRRLVATRPSVLGAPFLVSPRASAETARFWERETDLIVENVRRYLGGMRLLNVVDQEAGY